MNEEQKIIFGPRDPDVVKMEEDLYETHPRMFSNRTSSKSCMSYGIGVKAGWRSLIDDLCDDLEQLEKEHGVEVLFDQVKEKFAVLRIYHTILENGEEISYQDERAKQISDLIHKAEEESAHTCEYCGEEGSFRNRLVWKKTLCDRDYIKRCCETLQAELVEDRLKEDGLYDGNEKFIRECTQDSLREQTRWMKELLVHRFSKDPLLELDCAIKRAAASGEMHNWIATCNNFHKSSDELSERYDELKDDEVRVLIIDSTNEVYNKATKTQQLLSKMLIEDNLAAGKEYTTIQLILFGFDVEFAKEHGVGKI